MFRTSPERRLTRVAQRLRDARAELAVLDEQLVAFTDVSDETSVKALVSEHHNDAREALEARRHTDAMRRSRAVLIAEIAQLERSQDQLLDLIVPHPS